MGITILMIAGEFDLSVAPMIAMSGYLFGTISTGADSVIVNTLLKIGLPVEGGNPGLAIFAALLVPSIMGSINGLLFSFYQNTFIHCHPGHPTNFSGSCVDCCRWGIISDH